jgi:cyclopropane-fatty-acyl-phospholipid synthase
MPSQGLQRLIDRLDFPTPFRVILPSGGEIAHGLGRPAFTIRLKSPRAVRDILLRSSLGFGEAYTRGEIDVDGDLEALVRLSFHIRERVSRGGLVERVRYALDAAGRRNSPRGSRRNIAAHYDLANDFYELWLDREAMQYTCAYFETPDDTLEAAQRRKMDRVCAKLDLRPGDHVVEAGGGWGGLALHMASVWGARVTSFNISAAQVEFARAKASRMGIGEDRLRYVQDDYRHIERHVAACDKFASICMLEHVGRESHAAFAGLVGRLLKPKGLGMIQFISRTRPARHANPWLEAHVFPGYYNPSLGEFVRAVEAQAPLQVIDVENMRYHYALTLRHWLQRLEASADVVRARWGEATLRTFRLYLSGGIADFEQGEGTLVYQALLSKGGDNAAPLNRRHHDGVVKSTAAAKARRLQTA